MKMLISWAGLSSFPPNRRHGTMAFSLLLAVSCFTAMNLFHAPASNEESRTSLEHRIGRESPIESRRDNEDDDGSLHYFVYTEKEISQQERVKLPPRANRMEDVLSEESIHEALLEHPWRTHDPNDASFFVIPTPVSALSFSGCKKVECTWYDDAFEALASHKVFRMHQGRRHVLVSLYWGNAGNKPFLRALRRHLRNVTVADHIDRHAVQHIIREGRADDGDWKKKFRKLPPLTESGFSVGLGLARAYLPLIEVSYEKFVSSNFTAFHRIARRKYQNNSTMYRVAPLRVRCQNLPGSPRCSFGYDLPHDQWAKHMSDSKFCLVMRGDTPHSHSLYNAIRVGCLPVVISDWYSEFAGSFKSTLDMSNFTVMINETTFLSDPQGQIGGLLHLSKEVIREKLSGLAYAQRVVFPDHERSLFVPAFFREVKRCQRD